MKDSLKIGLGIVIGVIGVILCGLCVFLVLGAGGLALLDTSLQSGSQSPLLDEASPTPQTVGAEVQHGDFAVTLLEYQFSDSYKDAYDADEEPPEGAKFLWIRILVRNAGQNSGYSPSPSDFSVIYLGEQIDSDFYFSGRSGYEQYDAGELFPGISREGWIRFTLPEAAEPTQIMVVFKPLELFGEEFSSWQLSP